MMKIQHKKAVNLLFSVWILIASFCAPYKAMAGFLEAEPFNADCASLSEYTSRANEDRWWEKPFEVVSQAAVKFGDETFKKVAPGAVDLVAVGLGLWLAVFCLKWVGSMTETDPLEKLTQVFGMMMKACIAAGLLKNQSYFFGYFVEPILSAGAGMAGLSGGGGSGLGATIEPMKKILDNAHIAMAQTQALGNLAMCISHIYKIEIFKIEFAGGILDPSVWANGCAVFCITWALMVCWPILIFDALFRLGITAALCPMFIAAWVFPITTKFAVKGLNSFLNIAFFYVCLNFAIKIGMKLLEGASGLETLIPDTDDAKTETVCLLKIGGGEGLAHCNEYAGESSSMGLMILAACAFYCILFLKQATVFANYFSDVAFSNDTAFQAAKATGNMAIKGASIGLKTGAAGMDKISQGLDRRAARTVEKGRKKGGVFESSREEKRYMRAEQRLRDRGFLDKKTGAETEAYGQLLRNGRRRQFMNFVTGGVLGKEGLLYKNNNYKTWAGPREAKDVANIQKDYEDYAASLASGSDKKIYKDLLKDKYGEPDKPASAGRMSMMMPTGMVPPTGSGTGKSEK